MSNRLKEDKLIHSLFFRFDCPKETLMHAMKFNGEVSLKIHILANLFSFLIKKY